MKNLFEELAVEAGIISSEPEDIVARPISEIILDDSEQEQPLDVLKHARDAREIADDLDDLADRAEKLADEDEGGVHGTISVESMHREYLTIVKANKLDFNAFSFEAAGTVSGQILGLRDDARRTALDLRNAAESMEAGVSRWHSDSASDVRLFENKNKSISLAVDNLRYVKNKLKDPTGEMREIDVSWNAVFTFLQASGRPVDDIAKAVENDKKYLQGVVTYLESSLSNLKNVKTANDSVKAADSTLVNTGSKLGSKSDYPLLGSEGVENFTLKTLPGAHNAEWARHGFIRKCVIVYGTLKSIQLGHKAAIAAGAVAAGATALIPALIKNGIITSGWIALTRAADKGGKDNSLRLSAISYDAIGKIVADALDLAALNNDKIDDLVVQAQGEVSRIKELGNKEALKAAKEQVSNMKNAAAILKHRIWYVTTRTARLAESAVVSL